MKKSLFGMFGVFGVVVISLILPLTVLAAGSGYPVAVIESLNDGSTPAGCGSLNSNLGGVAEVSLDLDADGVADLCLGSSTPTCNAVFSYDCSSGSGGSLCSTEDSSIFSNTLMDDELTLAANLGDAVGPNFFGTTNSTSAVPADTELVIGFSGASLNPGVKGYFGLSVDSTDCSYTFTDAYLDDGDAVINYGDVPVFTVDSVADFGDAVIDGICDTGSLRGAPTECTLRAAIEEANQINALKHIHFDIPALDCVGGSCVIDVDIISNGSLPDLITPVVIDGTTQTGSETLCQVDISSRAQYGIVVQGDLTDIGLRLAEGSEGSTLKGLNIRNFFNNVAIINSDDNLIQCNFIGTDETGTAGSGGNLANGIIVGCESNNNIIGGASVGDGNLISNQDGDGIQFFAGFMCAPSSSLPFNNAILGNFIGTLKDGVTPMGNQFSGISFFGGAAFNNYIGSLQDGSTINGNVIADNESGIYIADGTSNTVILGNYLGTDLTGTANLGNFFGGVDIILGNDNQIGGINPGEGNVVAYNSEGIFITGLTSSGNEVRGNQSMNNLTTAIDIIVDGSVEPDGFNINDADDADTGANMLMNHPDVASADFINVLDDIFADVAFSVDATNVNAAYPLQIDAYFDENSEGSQGGTFVLGETYNTPQASANIIFDIPDGITGGVLRLTATDADGNTSEMSPAIQVGIIDLIFKDGFE